MWCFSTPCSCQIEALCYATLPLIVCSRHNTLYSTVLPYNNYYIFFGLLHTSRISRRIFVCLRGTQFMHPFSIIINHAVNANSTCLRFSVTLWASRDKKWTERSSAIRVSNSSCSAKDKGAKFKWRNVALRRKKSRKHSDESVIDSTHWNVRCFMRYSHCFQITTVRCLCLMFFLARGSLESISPVPQTFRLWQGRRGGEGGVWWKFKGA